MQRQPLIIDTRTTPPYSKILNFCELKIEILLFHPTSFYLLVVSITLCTGDNNQNLCILTQKLYHFFVKFMYMYDEINTSRAAEENMLLRCHNKRRRHEESEEIEGNRHDTWEHHLQRVFLLFPLEEEK